MKKYAIFITVYKHRSTSMLSNIDKLDSKFDVYIVAQANDTELEQYYQYKTADNIQILVPDVSSIFEKREYIRQFAINNNYDGFFQIDDDVEYVAFSIENSTPRKTSGAYITYKCDFNLMLNRVIEKSIEHDAALASVTQYENVCWRKPHEVSINSKLNFAQFVYIATDKIKDISYDMSGEINEDLDILIRLLQHGRKAICVCDYGFKINNKAIHNIAASTLYDNSLYKYYKFILNTSAKYHPTLWVKNGRLRTRYHYKKYWNTTELPPIDDKVLDMCKNGQANELIEYLIKQKEK